MALPVCVVVEMTNGPSQPSSRAALMKGTAACTSPTETAWTHTGRRPRSAASFSGAISPWRSSLPSVYFALSFLCESAKNISIAPP